MWDEIAHPFLNFNGCTVEVKEWVSDFIPHFRMDRITKSMLVKGAPGRYMLTEEGKFHIMLWVSIHMSRAVISCHYTLIMWPISTHIIMFFRFGYDCVWKMSMAKFTCWTKVYIYTHFEFSIRRIIYINIYVKMFFTETPIRPHLILPYQEKYCICLRTYPSRWSIRSFIDKHRQQVKVRAGAAIAKTLISGIG